MAHVHDVGIKPETKFRRFGKVETEKLGFHVQKILVDPIGFSTFWKQCLNSK